jgi:predicted nucleic acid-binding protein
VTGFLLDTNVLSEFSRNGEPNPRVRTWLFAAPPDLLYASVLTTAEIRRGIELLAAGKRRHELEVWLENILVESFQLRLLPVTRTIADRWAVISASAQRSGLHVAIFDGLIAATALEHGLTVVTRNVKDFAGTGAAIFNPWEG